MRDSLIKCIYKPDSIFLYRNYRNFPKSKQKYIIISQNHLQTTLYIDRKFKAQEQIRVNFLKILCVSDNICSKR